MSRLLPRSPLGSTRSSPPGSRPSGSPSTRTAGSARPLGTIPPRSSTPLSPPATSSAVEHSDSPQPGGDPAMQAHHVTMLGTGLIGDFYTATLHGQRGRDHVRVVFSKSEGRAAAFAERWSIPEHTTDLRAAIEHADTDVVVVGVPNYLHEEAVSLAAAAGKAILCTKPLGRTA